MSTPENVDTCWHFIFNLLHLSFGQPLFGRGLSWHTGQISSQTWIRSATTQSNVDQLRQSVNAEMHGSAQLPSLNLVNRMDLSKKSDLDVQSVGYKSAQSPTNWESIHGKVPSILCRLSSSLSIALDDSYITQNAKSKIVDIRWYKKLVRIFLLQNVIQKKRICCQHNYNVFGAKAHAKRPEIWDVPDWFRCMCEFQVRQMMSPQNGYISI